MSFKERLHQLVEELPDAELHTAERFLEYLRSLQDEVDHEPLSQEALDAIREGQEALKRGEYITLEEYRRMRGL
ncbi:MAG: hypothetical protein HY238_19355 [Acidobacteria bacterium]|nr:hypothetical protein [Acidobacteriota bacterium]